MNYRNETISLEGVLDIDIGDGLLRLNTEDCGYIDLDKILHEFDGQFISITISKDKKIVQMR